MQSIHSSTARSLVIGLAVGFVGVLLALVVANFVLRDPGTVGLAAATAGLAMVIIVPTFLLLFAKHK